MQPSQLMLNLDRALMDLCVKEWGNLMECNGSTRVQPPKWFVNGIDLGNTFKMIDETSFFHKKHHFFFIRAVNSLGLG